MSGVIPALDIKGGQVVRAQGGHRGAYRPLRSRLTCDARPHAVLRALLSAPCGIDIDTVYVADIDALAGGGDNRARIRALAEAFPAQRFWVDGGFRTYAALGRYGKRVLPVVAGESVPSQRALAVMARHCGGRLVLSLDYRRRFLGPCGLWRAGGLWPHRVIVMALSRVGAGTGPPLALVAAVRSAAPRAMLFAAGGISGLEDVATLARARVGALAASLFYDGGVS